MPHVSVSFLEIFHWLAMTTFIPQKQENNNIKKEERLEEGEEEMKEEEESTAEESDQTDRQDRLWAIEREVFTANQLLPFS